jgi:hypothetical protein
MGQLDEDVHSGGSRRSSPAPSRDEELLPERRPTEPDGTNELRRVSEIRGGVPKLHGKLRRTTQRTRSEQKQTENFYRLQIENSWAGKCLRRWRFAVRYYRARTRWGSLRRLEPFLRKSFESGDENGRNDWISHVIVKLRAWPGREDREFLIPWRGDGFLLRLRLLPWREEGCSVNWSSPVVAMVFKRGKDRGNPVAVRYMSFFIEDDTIHVTQLQGMRKMEMPPGLKDWTERMLRACVAFARNENLRGVSVALARSRYSFHHPYVYPWLSPEEREREVARIRERMQTHLDGTASALGWPLEGQWFKWINPTYGSGSGSSVPRRTLKRLLQPQRHWH